MQDRYSLRFETGERAGEVVPLATSPFTVGRKPDNALQIAEPSVSGRHAELRVDASGVLLVDVGSTNGTRVGDESVTERRLAHGDRVTFGNVTVAFADEEFAAPRAAGGGGVHGGGALPDDDQDDVHSISAADLERSGKKSKLGLVVILLLLVGGGGAAWFLTQGEGGGGRRSTPVVPVAGNLLAASYSFEQDGDQWSDAEGVEANFLARGQAAHTGDRGMRALLEGEERARLVSTDQRASTGRSLEAAVFVRASDQASARVGVVFAFGGNEGAVPGEQTAWSDWAPRDDEWTELRVAAAVPAGAKSARVVIDARSAGGGTVDVDDASLVEAAGGSEPAAKHMDFQAHLLGDPAQALAVRKVDRILLSDLRVETAGDAFDAPTLQLTQDGEEFVLGLAGGASRALSLRVEPAALDGGLASLGEGGRKVHGAQFEREGVASLLIGGGFDLMRLHFDSPVTVTGRPEDDGVRVTVELGANDRAAIEVDFHAETAAARGLADRGRRAESDGRMGDAYAAWRELRDVYPYDAGLLVEAESSMQRIAQGGLDALVAVREDVERARFFRLREGYERCRERAIAVGERYSNSVVQAEAVALVAEIDELASGLEAELATDEVQRLRGILTALEASNSSRLAAEVRGYLENTYGVRD